MIVLSCPQRPSPYVWIVTSQHQARQTLMIEILPRV